MKKLSMMKRMGLMVGALGMGVLSMGAGEAVKRYCANPGMEGVILEGRAGVYSSDGREKLEGLAQVALGGMTRDRETVGPDEWFYRSFVPEKNGGLWPRMAHRKEDFWWRNWISPVGNEPMVLGVVSPEVMGGGEFRPTAVYVQGQRIVVEINDTASMRPVKTLRAREVYYSYLPALAPGKYTLRVEVHQRFDDGRQFVLATEKEMELLDPSKVKVERTGPVTIEDVMKGEAKEVQEEWRVQEGNYWAARSMKLEGPGGKYGLFAGTCVGMKTDPFPTPFDAMRKTENGPVEIVRLPLGVNEAVVAPVKDEPLYAMVYWRGVNSGEWMSMRSVTWKRENETWVGRIEADLWEDSMERSANFISHPMLLTELKPPGDRKGGLIVPKGRYVMELAVHQMKADVMGGWYEEQKAVEDGIELKRVAVEVK